MNGVAHCRTCRRNVKIHDVRCCRSCGGWAVQGTTSYSKAGEGLPVCRVEHSAGGLHCLRAYLCCEAALNAHSAHREARTDWNSSPPSSTSALHAHRQMKHFTGPFNFLIPPQRLNHTLQM